ncbi:hypothetical protein BABINDRAFT_66265 [Babjeviella inositovora NRRL Y-12698]|uniref:FAD-binding domain-containing protein n=1 Tax=Babjeviella inositovora NRRL Y-12698 TaxID=984486 RepID=A0A1E3QKZ6_9ASCO|nr:uncharacterized protein BABINDRAFT_66265 [Babjeviella inositovora NRRL Y-12698]ODQ78134.1 hypothetical protein BABINDRAFT_66265 [Babjeviella inositovora NRRL Y-12698]
MTHSINTSETDVLIIGAGPAGLMAACWLARTGVPFRIVDKRSAKIFAGQADGLQSRTLEVFQSFGFGDRAEKAANHFEDMCFWSPNEKGDIIRKGRNPDSVQGISRFTECVIHQGNIEQWITDSITKWSQGQGKVERATLPLKMSVDESLINDTSAYPVSVLVKKLNEDDEAVPEQYGAKVTNGLYRQFDGDQDKFYSDLQDGLLDDTHELIKCKYVVGSDGAHSWVRKQLGIDMIGDTTDFVWGVLDMVPLTDFPDIRNRCAIHSKDAGSIMVIPRERDLVRLYIQLHEVPRLEDTTKSEFGGGDAAVSAKGSTTGRVDRSKITTEFIVKQAQEIFKPYTFDITDLDWFTGYQIGQRVSPQFQAYNRIFIAGDACHTHSPKAGQGMNVSMMDTYNLGWKLAHVCKGLAKPEILETYEAERIQIARDLIAFDHKLSRMFSGRPMVPNSEGSSDGVDMAEFQAAFKKGAEFASGTIVDYAPSILEVKEPTPNVEVQYYTKYATKVGVGRRLDSSLIQSQAEGRPWHLADRIPSDGRWRVLNFCGDIKNPELAAANKELSCFLLSGDGFAQYTPVNARTDSVVEVLTIHATPRYECEGTDFPQGLWPKDSHGRNDYWKIYAGIGTSFHKGPCDIYEFFGINTNKGCYIILRPDGYVSHIVPVGAEGIKEIQQFFARFMLPQTQNVLQKDANTPDTDRFFKPVLAV